MNLGTKGRLEQVFQAQRRLGGENSLKYNRHLAHYPIASVMEPEPVEKLRIHNTANSRDRSHNALFNIFIQTCC